MKKNGFTLVEILAVVAIIAILAVAAAIGVNSIIIRQRERTASMSENSIAEASLSFFTSQKAVYMEACRSEDDKYITFNEELLKSINNNLRDELSVATSNKEKIEIAKNYVYMINNDEFAKKDFNDQYTQVKNLSCFKLVTVAELEEKGLFVDTEEACDKTSVILVYQSASSVNSTGTLAQTQEIGICNGKRKLAKTTILTVTPEKDYQESTSKSIDINIYDEKKKLNRKADIKYAWSTSPNTIPTNWKDVVSGGIITNGKEGFGSVEAKNLVGIYYLWIKSQGSVDKNNYTISPIVFGPYNFSSLTITYDTSGGTECAKPIKEIVKGKAYRYNSKGENDKLCETTRESEGYVFDGWYTPEGTKVTDDTIVTKNESHVLKARWKGKKENITYETNGGTACVPNYKEVTVGESYGNLCTTTKAGFNFGGWNTEEDGTGKTITADNPVEITEDHTLYAMWVGAPIRMTYDEMGGTPCNPKEVILYNGSNYGEMCETTKGDEIFAGWYKSNTFSGEPIDDQETVSETSDFTVYAKFEKEEFELIYDSEGGSGCDSKSITKYKGEKWGTLCNPTRSGYAFLGWYNLNPSPESDDDDVEPVLVTKDSIANQDITVNARWEVNSTKVDKTIKSYKNKKTITFTTKKILDGTTDVQKYTCKNISNIKSCTCIKAGAKKVKCTVVFKKATATKSDTACQKLAKLKGKGGTWHYIKDQEPAKSKNNYNRSKTGSGCYKLKGYSPTHTGSNWICKREPHTLYNAKKEHCVHVSGADATYGWDSGRNQCRCYDYLGSNYINYYEGKIRVTIKYKPIA